MPLAVYGGGIGAILSLGLLSWTHHPLLWWRALSLSAVFATCFLFNITLINTWALLQGEAVGVEILSDFVELLPYCFAFTSVQLALPIVTISVLFLTGHRIEVASREPIQS